MKRRKPQELTVFSTSAIDLFCSALGVFMIVFFMAISVPKPFAAQSDSAPQASGNAAGLKLGASETLLLFSIMWEPFTSATGEVPDVDLVVKLPNRSKETTWNYFEAEKRVYKDQSGGLIYDMIPKKGDEGHDGIHREYWAMVAPEDGEYMFYVRVFHPLSAGPTYGYPSENPPTIEWSLYSDDFPKTFGLDKAERRSNVAPENYKPDNIDNGFHLIGTATVSGGKLVQFKHRDGTVFTKDRGTP